MTREEWEACEDPYPMLRFLFDKGSDRKFRLFACACCRANETLRAQPGAEVAVAAVEQWADGLSTWERVVALCNSDPLGAGGAGGLEWVSHVLARDDGYTTALLVLLDLRNV